MTAVLYIIARNDLASMNPGKLAAQASHASNAFVHHYQGFCQDYSVNPSNSQAKEIMTGFREWETQTPQGFGTVLVLEAKMSAITPVIDVFSKIGYIAGVVHDPTYPLLDGQVVHHVPLDTCAYVFVPNKEQDQIASLLLAKFPLHS